MGGLGSPEPHREVMAAEVRAPGEPAPRRTAWEGAGAGRGEGGSGSRGRAGSAAAGRGLAAVVFTQAAVSGARLGQIGVEA